jgi:D-3-phosphoglycerate dehydrogenase / 2-oxoglutarate reductase
MIRILANDGIHPDGRLLLEEANVQIDATKYSPEELPAALKNYDGILVRSATKVRKELIDQVPNLKIIGRAGVGLDNIDVEYARQKGIYVFNTPGASSRAVAELAFAHMFNLARNLHIANRTMPEKGNSEFGKMKKELKNGFQLQGKKLGIVGFGRIGREVAKIGIGLGMQIYAADLVVEEGLINFEIYDSGDVFLRIKVHTVDLSKIFEKCDIISFHVPLAGGKPMIGSAEIAKMKDGVILINTSRGGVIDEDVLLSALESGKVAGAGLDVFVNEPQPRPDLLAHPNVSLSPHIGAETQQAQSNIGMEMAEKIIEHFGLNL